MSMNPLFDDLSYLSWFGGGIIIVSNAERSVRFFQSNILKEISRLLLTMHGILPNWFKSRKWRLINLWMQIFDKTSSIPTFWGQVEKSISKVYLLFFEEIELYQCSWNNSSLSGQVKMKRLDPYYQKYSRLR